MPHYAIVFYRNVSIVIYKLLGNKQKLVNIGLVATLLTIKFCRLDKAGSNIDL